MAISGVITPEYKPRFKEARKAAGLTQAKVAEKLGMSDTAYYRDFEKGRVKPNGETLSKLSDLFGVSIDYLLGRCPDYKTMGNAFIGEYTGLTDRNIEILYHRFHYEYMIFGRFHTLHPKPAISPDKDGRCQEIMHILNELISSKDFYHALESVKTMCDNSDYWQNIIENSVGDERDDAVYRMTGNSERLRGGFGIVELSGSDAVDYYADKATRLFREAIMKIAMGGKADGND